MNIDCIENFFTVQDFWETCACPEKQGLPWKFSLYWIYLLHSGFLSNLHLPWKTECALNSLHWIYIFYHSRFLSNLRLPWKQSCFAFFHCIEIFDISQDFWSTCVCPEKQSLPWTFSLYWNIWYHSGILSNLHLPWKQSLPWNFLSQVGCRLPQNPRLVRLWQNVL